MWKKMELRRSRQVVRSSGSEKIICKAQYQGTGKGKGKAKDGMITSETGPTYTPTTVSDGRSCGREHVCDHSDVFEVSKPT